MPTDRRGFISKLGSVFKRRGETIFFGVQVAVNIAGEDALRANLHNVIASGDSQESPEAKRAYYKRIATLLLSDQAFYEYGFWDYITNANKAEAEFNQWVNELEGGIATEQEELGDGVDEAHRLSSDKSYVIVTLAFLLENAEPLGNFIERIEAIPEEDYFTRSGFSVLTDAINYIDFEFCLADASFIMPGNAQDGISWEDLRAEGWEYLKPIMGV